MHIYVDADACPVVDIIEDKARKYKVSVTLLCDTNHVLSSAYSEVMLVGAGADAVDYKLISICRKGDIVVSQDYGVAAMALATPPESVLQAMEKQMQAERNKRATILTSEGQKAAAILKSEGEKTAIINKAEADKQMAILNAEGEAQAKIRKAEAEAVAIEKITEAVGKSTNPANYLLAQKYIQMMQELAAGDKTKTVYLPYETTNLLGSIGGIKDLFKSE